MSKRVQVKDLKDQMGTPYPRPFLFCAKCGAQYSANAGDYWNAPADHTFKCCKRNMVLAVKQVVEVAS